MKSTTVFMFIFAVLTISFSKSIDYYPQHEDSFLDACCVPLNLTQPHSIRNFLQNVFSNRRYAHEYLPFNTCTHLMTFLEHGKEFEKQVPYIESSLRLFYNRLKECPFVCNKSVSKMLDSVPHVMKNYCGMHNENSLESGLEADMMGIFVPSFVSEFSLFRADPENFLKKMAHDVTSLVAKSFKVEDHVAREQLRQMFIRFLDLALMKILWNPEEQSMVWDSMKKISVQLSDVMEMGLITPDDLDDLYKSLLESFYRFLDLAGSGFSLSLVDTMKEDVCSGELLIFELEEQEDYTETKKDRMLHALLEVEARIEARIQGIITDVIAY